MAWVLNRDLPMESTRRISYKRHENFGEQSNGGKKLRREEKGGGERVETEFNEENTK
jgi:hypothetical protein